LFSWRTVISFISRMDITVVSFYSIKKTRTVPSSLIYWLLGSSLLLTITAILKVTKLCLHYCSLFKFYTLKRVPRNKEIKSSTQLIFTFSWFKTSGFIVIVLNVYINVLVYPSIYFNNKCNYYNIAICEFPF